MSEDQTCSFGTAFTNSSMLTSLVKVHETGSPDDKYVRQYLVIWRACDSLSSKRKTLCIHLEVSYRHEALTR